MPLSVSVECTGDAKCRVCPLIVIINQIRLIPFIHSVVLSISWYHYGYSMVN